MAHRVRNTIDYDEEDTVGSSVVRFFFWAGLAAIAVGSVVLAAQSPIGAERLAALGGHRIAVASPIQPKTQAAPAARSADADVEQRRLAESVRLLGADRDRLLARVEALERNIDVTGSLPRESAAAPTAEAPFPPHWHLLPSTSPQAAAGPPGAGPAPTRPRPGPAAA